MAGVVALAAGLVPVVGDVVAVPMAVVAVTVGVVGMLRYDQGRAVRVASAMAGSVLGALALLGAVLIAAATHLSP